MDNFANYKNLPLEVQAVLDKHSGDDETYATCQELQDELEQIGWTCEWGLDAVPYGLRKIKSDKPTLSGDPYECMICGDVKELLIFNASESWCKDCNEEMKRYETKTHHQSA